MNKKIGVASVEPNWVDKYNREVSVQVTPTQTRSVKMCDLFLERDLRAAFEAGSDSHHVKFEDFLREYKTKRFVRS